MLGPIEPELGRLTNILQERERLQGREAIQEREILQEREDYKRGKITREGGIRSSEILLLFRERRAIGSN